MHISVAAALPDGLDMIAIPGGFSFGDGAAAQIIAEREAAGDSDHVQPVRQGGILVPDHPRLAPGGAGQGDGQVAVAI